MRVVRGSTTQLEVMRRDSITALGLCVAGLLVILLVFLTGLGGIAAFLLLLIGLCLLGVGIWFGWQAYQERETQQIHERLIALLEKALDDGFIYFRNLVLQDNRSIGVIDGVLLGPHGALVIELANFAGDYICEGDTWYRFVGGTNPKAAEHPDLYRRRLKDSPTWHVIRAAREVKAWLSVRKLPQVPVQPLVVLTKGRLHSVKRPSGRIVELNYFESFLRDNVLSPAVNADSGHISEGMLEQIAERLKVKSSD